MNKSYALLRPKSAPEMTPKRQRRKIQSLLIKDNNEKNTFEYSCFDCLAPMNIDNHSEIEIECEVCSGRIIRKNKTDKDRVVEAI